MSDPLVETWKIHDRINRYLLDALDDEALAVRPSGKGRSVGELFAHVHGVRLMWVKSASPDLLAGLAKIDAGAETGTAALGSALEASGDAIATTIARSVEAGGRVKGFKPHVTAFVGYLVSHESHHRGQVLACLRAAGKPLDKKISYGLWEWGVR